MMYASHITRLLLVAAAASTVQGRVERIVGGISARQDEFPFYTSMLCQSSTSSSSFYPCCGASLITAEWVLAAAHCCVEKTATCTAWSRRVRVKALLYDTSSDTQDVARNVIQIINHESYDVDTTENDIMLLKMSSPVNVPDSNVSITNEPTIPAILMNLDFAEPTTGTLLTVIGLGTVSSGGSPPSALLKVSVPVISASSCKTQLSSLGYRSFDSHVMMCAGYAAGGKDSCQGDSGGPLFAKALSNSSFIQYGVVSFGFGCADANSPGVYARVDTAAYWISGKVGLPLPAQLARSSSSTSGVTIGTILGVLCYSICIGAFAYVGYTLYKRRQTKQQPQQYQQYQQPQHQQYPQQEYPQQGYPQQGYPQAYQQPPPQYQQGYPYHGAQSPHNLL